MVDRAEVRRLRVDEGKSLREIAEILGISKATASLVCRGFKPRNMQGILDNIKRNSKSSSECARRKHLEAVGLVKEQAEAEWEMVKLDPEMQLFLGLYWGEGCKTNGTIGVINTDAWVIKHCIHAFKRLCPFAKLCVAVRYYPDQDPAVCREYWERQTGEKVSKMVDVAKYDKRVGSKKPKSKYGICLVRFNDWPTFIRIMYWIDRLRF